MKFRLIAKYLLLIVLLIKPIYSDVPLGLKGIKGGATFSNFYDMNDVYKQGYLFGVFGEKQLFRNASLSWEAIFTTKGGIIKDTPIILNSATTRDDMHIYDVHCSVRFLEIPIYLKVVLPIAEKFSLFVISGPSILSARKDLSSLKNKKNYMGTREEFEEESLNRRKFLDYNADEYSFNRLDKSLRLGFNWGIGFKYNRYIFESTYSKLCQDLGELANIYHVHLRTCTIRFILGVTIFDSK